MKIDQPSDNSAHRQFHLILPPKYLYVFIVEKRKIFSTWIVLHFQACILHFRKAHKEQ